MIGQQIASEVLNSFNLNLYIENMEFKQMKTNGYGNLVYKTLINIEDNLKEVAKKENAYFDICYKQNLSTNYDIAYNEDYQNETYKNTTFYTNVSLESFKKDGLVITKGRFFKENETNAVICLTNTYINNEEVNIGATLTIKTNNASNDYNVIGLFTYENANDVIQNKTFYDDPTIIINKEDLLTICSDENIAPVISRLNFSFTNGYRIKDLEKEIKEAIDDAIKTTRLNGRIINDNLLSNYDQYEKIVAPSKSLKMLYTIISIVISFISCLLLINIISYLSNKRLKEFAILNVLGENKIKSIMAFAGEIIIITNIAISIALPIGIKIANLSFDMLLKDNLKRQERLAYITGNQEDIDIFEKQNELYNNYQISIYGKDFLSIYLINNMLVLISCFYIFIRVSKTMPRILFLK